MTQTTHNQSIDTALHQFKQRVDDLMLCQIDQTSATPDRLQCAMHYCIANGGKRLRPCLVYLSAQSFGADANTCDAAAMAVEYIHSYSLVHDDLPAMDDDDLRRGQPSTHIAFDEATAILVGDALQSLAFETLSAESPWLSTSQQLKMIHLLSQAAGSCGMVGGQILDLAAESQSVSLSQLQTIHTLKTGALIQASVLLGAIAADVTSEPILRKLRKFGHHIGLAFQIHDDILDVTQSSETLGKPQQSDVEANKSTYVSLLGLEHAERMRDEQHQLALSALEQLPIESEMLQQLATKLIDRQC